MDRATHVGQAAGVDLSKALTVGRGGPYLALDM